MTHFIDICVCVFEGRDGVPSGLLIVGETLLVGIELVARGTGFEFEGFGSRGDRGFAERA
jgi:hypothetical protein